VDDQLYKGKSIRGLTRILCFAAFGAVLFSNPMNRLNPFNLVFGILIALIFGGLFKLFLKSFLSLFNSAVKKEKGSRAIAYAVENGMLYLVPFAIMAMIATFYLEWSLTTSFISTGIMAVGTASAIEMGKLMQKPSVKNTLITSVVSFLFSFTLTLSVPLLTRVPGFVEGIVTILPTLLGKGGGGL
jgi:hypothetical protein